MPLGSMKAAVANRQVDVLSPPGIAAMWFPFAVAMDVCANRGA